MLIHLSSTTTRTPVVRMRLVSLESLLELGEELAILVKLGLELSQLRKLHGFVILKWGSTCPSFLGVLGSSLTVGARAPVVASCVSSVVATAPSMLKHSLVGSQLSDSESRSGSVV